MKNTITIFCRNDNKEHKIELGTSLSQLAKDLNINSITDKKTKIEYPILVAMVDNSLKDLNYKIFKPHEVEFIAFNHPDGRRAYIHSLCFVLQNAVSSLFPDKNLIIDHSLPNGLYCELREIKEKDSSNAYFIKQDEIEQIRIKMKDIIDKDLIFTSNKLSREEAVSLFEKQHQYDKAELLRSLGWFYFDIYYLDGRADTFHAPLVNSTGILQTYDLMGFNKGFCLQLPSINDGYKLMPIRRQSKIAAALEDYSKWCNLMRIQGVGTLNKEINNGNALEIINLSESMQERKYAEIADQINAAKGEIKIIFIAGPSSSGKTSSALRLANQCKLLGLKPKVIELDNYFVDREHTPIDENGEYDFESLYAMDLKLLNSQLNDLIAGKEVDIPKFNFKNGTRTFGENKMQLHEKDILIMEGIHALNPEMVSEVDQSKVFRVYASALTSLNIDENNHISSSDNRLLRRMVRDNRVRGISPEDTILRWHSVRRGESKNIFPFQENCDALFNSALLFELPLLKYYAEPLLRRISPASAAYPEAKRLLKFLDYIVALQPHEIEAIPPISIMREFIGGQCL